MIEKDVQQKKNKIVGEIFAQMREERGVSQAQVAENLLSQRTLSGFEQKGEMPCWLVMNALMQRLGKNADYFVPVLSKKEYEYLLWKSDMLKKLQSGSVLLKDWEGDMADSRSIHPILQQQFVQFWRGCLTDDIPIMTEAVSLTVSGYPQKLSVGSCVSTEEMTYILICMEKKLRLYPGKWWEEVGLLKSVLTYMESCYQKDVRVKIYYKAVCLYGTYIQGAESHEKLLYYKKALKLHRELANLNGLEDILRGILRESEHLGITDLQEYKDYLSTLEEIREEYQIESGEFVGGQLHQEYYLLHEVLKNYREERQLKVKEIDEAVCSEKTYRALEKGKRNANKSTYVLLAEFMEIPFYTYSAEIVTDQYSDLVQAAKLRQAQKRGDADAIQSLLCELDKSLGDKRNLVQNRQFMESIRDFELYFAREITPEEYKDRVERTIRLTIPEWTMDYGAHFYTRREMILVYYEAVVYRDMRQYETAIHLMELLWEKIESSEMDKQYRMNEVLLILVLWKNLLSDIGAYDEALKKAEIGVRMCFSSGRGDMLDDFVFEPGWILLKKNPDMPLEERRAKGFGYVRNALCLDKLFYERNAQRAIEDYIEENYTD